jgi:Zn finger protein HypA/HybF involved in hydrogenase expression
MKKFYATTEQAEQIKGETKSCQCDCGQSYAIVLNDQTEVIICDACHENSSKIEQYF